MNHNEVLHIGRRVDKVVIIAIHDKTYVAQCDCGKKLHKQKHAQIPQMCQECAKVQHRSNFVPGDNNHEYIIRNYTKAEAKMIKKFKKANK